jgi:hypothetical protein
MPASTLVEMYSRAKCNEGTHSAEGVPPPSGSRFIIHINNDDPVEVNIGFSSIRYIIV